MSYAANPIHKTVSSEIPESVIAQSLCVAETEGYRAAFDFLLHKYPELSNYLASAVRMDWLFHCYSEPRGMRSLELNSELGTQSFLLGPYFKEIVSLESIVDMLVFQQKRAVEGSIRNLKLVLADKSSMSLPFRNDLFDLIICNDTLSRIPDNSSAVLFLKEVKRCLKPGGCLYIGTENLLSRMLRKSYDFLTGKSSPSDTGRERSIVRTHARYLNLLNDAGFGPIDRYWAYPSHNYPKYAAHLDDKQTFAYFFEHLLKSDYDEGSRKRWLMSLATLVCVSPITVSFTYFWPSVLIFAWKEYKPKTLEQTIVQRSRENSLLRVSGGDGKNSRISYLGLSNNRLHSVWRMSRYPWSGTPEREERLLNEYAGKNFKKHSVGRLTFYGRKPADGRQCRYRVPSDNVRAIEWLLRFQAHTVSRELAYKQIRHESPKILDFLARLEIEIPTQKVRYALDEFARLLALSKVRACSEHGDFWPSNILIKDHKVAVLDWEFYRRLGNPLFDFCYFLLNNSANPEADFYNNFLGSGPYSNILSLLVETFQERSNITLKMITSGIPYVLSRCIVRYSVFSDTCSPTGYRFHVRLLSTWLNRIWNLDLSWLGN